MKPLAHAFLAVVMLIFPGCLKLEENLTIKNNASGSLELSYQISEQSVSRLKALTKIRNHMDTLSGNETPPPADNLEEIFLSPSEDAIRKELKRYEKYGITIDRIKVESRDTWRSVQMKLLFNNLADVTKADFFNDYGFSLSKNQNGDFVIFRDRESRNPAAAGSLPDPETLKTLSPLLDGFSCVFKINVPGRILASNAPQKSVYTAIYPFNYDRDPNAIVEMQNTQVKITFDGQGIDLPTFTQKPSTRAR